MHQSGSAHFERWTECLNVHRLSRRRVLGVLRAEGIGPEVVGAALTDVLASEIETFALQMAREIGKPVRFGRAEVEQGLHMLRTWPKERWDVTTRAMWSGGSLMASLPSSPLGTTLSILRLARSCLQSCTGMPCCGSPRRKRALYRDDSSNL
jgi:hypothetical protein